MALARPVRRPIQASRARTRLEGRPGIAAAARPGTSVRDAWTACPFGHAAGRVPALVDGAAVPAGRRKSGGTRPAIQAGSMMAPRPRVGRSLAVPRQQRVPIRSAEIGPRRPQGWPAHGLPGAAGSAAGGFQPDEALAAWSQHRRDPAHGRGVGAPCGGRCHPEDGRSPGCRQPHLATARHGHARRFRKCRNTPCDPGHATIASARRPGGYGPCHNQPAGGRPRSTTERGWPMAPRRRSRLVRRRAPPGRCRGRPHRPRRLRRPTPLPGGARPDVARPCR